MTKLICATDITGITKLTYTTDITGITKLTYTTDITGITKRIYITDITDITKKLSNVEFYYFQGIMNKKQWTLIHFDYGGHYVRKEAEVAWISREDVNHALVIKKSSEEVTYTLLVEGICKKMGVDEVRSVMKISYIPLVVDPKKPIYIFDDGDLLCYLELYEDHTKSVLHVEVVDNQSYEQIQRCDKLPRDDAASQYGASNEDMISSARKNNRVDYGNMFDVVVHDEERRDLNNIGCEVQGELDNIVSEERGELDNIVSEERRDLDNLFMNEDIEVTPSVEVEPANMEWEDGMNVTLHQEFASKEDVQILIEKAAHVNCFQYAIVNSDTRRYVVKCCGEKKGCKWYLRAAKHMDSSFFSIRTYNKIHTCSRASSSTTTKRRCGSSRLVASILQDDFPGTLETPCAKNVIDLVQGRVGIKVSHTTAWRGKNKACENVRGSSEDSYKMLFSYMYMLEKMNSGTVTYVELDEDQKFKYLFFALGASIEGFAAMRKVIIVDGTHLKHVIGGVLIVATAQDPNHHHYPIAFGVADGEKYSSLIWFFSKLKTIVPDSGDLVFVTDRNPNLISSIGEVYPLALHGYCTYHLSQNVKLNCPHVHKKTLAKSFRAIAELYTECEFEKRYGEFSKRYPAARAYLDRSCEETWKWARCYFPGERYDIYTTNACESINGVLREARKYSLLPMIDVIIGKLAEWFNLHRQESTDGGILVPFIEKVLHPLCPIAQRLKVTVLNSFFLDFSVRGSDGNNYLVDLKRKTCTCKRFDIDKYPCVHAIAALIEARKNGYTTIEIHDLCSKCYWMDHWALAYYRTIYPVPHMSQWIIPDHIRDMVALPPDYVSKRGRPQSTRYPSVGEHRRRGGNSSGRGLYSWFECSSPSSSQRE